MEEETKNGQDVVEQTTHKYFYKGILKIILLKQI